MDGRDFVYGQNWIHQYQDAMMQQHHTRLEYRSAVSQRRMIDCHFAWFLTPQEDRIWDVRNQQYLRLHSIHFTESHLLR